MLYFNPKPNYQILNKYYKFQYLPDRMDDVYPEGFPIVIDWLDTDEKVKEFEDQFLHILEKYQLQDHFDNLSFLYLNALQQIDALLYELRFQHAQLKRTKELAGLLLGFIQNSRNEYYGLLLKTFKSINRLTDQVLIEWVGRIVKEAVTRGDMSIGDFQFDIKEAFFDNIDGVFVLNEEKLIIENEKTVHSPTKDVNALLADFFLRNHNYLLNETNINPDKTVKFSDAQLNFYFDILVLFEFINPDNVKSDNKDYMSALLRNRLKKLNSQGNKSK